MKRKGEEERTGNDGKDRKGFIYRTGEWRTRQEKREVMVKKEQGGGEERRGQKRRGEEVIVRLELE